MTRDNDDQFPIQIPTAEAIDDDFTRAREGEVARINREIEKKRDENMMHQRRCVLFSAVAFCALREATQSNTNHQGFWMVTVIGAVTLAQIQFNKSRNALARHDELKQSLADLDLPIASISDLPIPIAQRVEEPSTTTTTSGSSTRRVVEPTATPTISGSYS